VPLEVGDFGATDEDILTCPGGCFVLLDLKFDNVGGVLDDFGDIRPMARANFAKDTLVNPDYTADQPETPEDTD
jgi:hypothetical protein